jgi:hypothetical protein
MAVSKAGYAYVLDGSARPLGGALPRGGAALVAQIAPDGRQVVTLELLGEPAPPPFTAPPGTPPTLGFHPYMFVAAPDGSGREVVVRRRSVTVRACAPTAGRLTVTLTRRGRRIARRTVSTPRSGIFRVRFSRPRGADALRATVRFRAS